MSLTTIKNGIEKGKFICPDCKKPMKKFDKYVEMTESVWDGAGDSGLETAGSKVTLTCGNENCDWSERTEYWRNYLHE